MSKFESTDVMKRAGQLAKVIEEGLLRLTELPAINAIRGEGTVWGVECAALGDRSADEVAHEIVRACYLGDENGKAIHLLGPLAGKVIRIAPPLVMPLDEAKDYLGVMHGIVAKLGA